TVGKPERAIGRTGRLRGAQVVALELRRARPAARAGSVLQTVHLIQQSVVAVGPHDLAAGEGRGQAQEDALRSARKLGDAQPLRTSAERTGAPERDLPPVATRGWPFAARGAHGRTERDRAANSDATRGTDQE